MLPFLRGISCNLPGPCAFGCTMPACVLAHASCRCILHMHLVHSFFTCILHAGRLAHASCTCMHRCEWTHGRIWMKTLRPLMASPTLWSATWQGPGQACLSSSRRQAGQPAGLVGGRAVWATCILHTQEHTHTHMLTRTCTHAHAHTHTLIHTHKLARIHHFQDTLTHTQYKHADSPTHACTHMLPHIHTCTPHPMHIHPHTHSHACTPQPPRLAPAYVAGSHRRRPDEGAPARLQAH